MFFLFQESNECFVDRLVGYAVHEHIRAFLHRRARCFHSVACTATRILCA